MNQKFGLNSRVLEDQTSNQRGKINKKRVEDDKQKENKEITFENCHKLECDSFQSANESENHKKKEHPFNKEKQEISVKIKKKYINTNNDKLEIENVKKRILNSDKSLHSKENDIYISARMVEKNKKNLQYRNRIYE